MYLYRESLIVSFRGSFAAGLSAFDVAVKLRVSRETQFAHPISAVNGVKMKEKKSQRSGQTHFFVSRANNPCVYLLASYVNPANSRMHVYSSLENGCPKKA